MTTKISIPITWPAVPGATKYTVAVSGKLITSTVPPTVHGLTVANGDAVVITATVPAPPPPPISSLFWLADAPINTPCAAPGTLNGVQNFYPPAGASDGDTVDLCPDCAEREERA